MEKYRILLLSFASIFSALIISVIAYTLIKNQTVVRENAVQPLEAMYITVR
jgi:hypothetical protein